MEEKKKKQIKKKKKTKSVQPGFTLIELLTTIVILTLVMGLGAFLVISLNNNSKEKVSAATISSVKQSTINYVGERGNTIGWLTESEDASLDEEYICVSVGALVDYGYFNREIFKNENLNRTDFVRLTRNKTTKSIVSEEFSDEVNNYCAASTAFKPTCKTITYNGSKQELLDNYNDLKLNSNNDPKQINAGTYNYVFSLKGDGKFTWEDGTISDYKLPCSINKYTCSIELANKEIRYDGNEHKYNINDVTIKGVGNTELTNYDTNGVSINYYKDSSYDTKATTVKDVLEYYTKVDVDLDNYNCSKDNIILDIYEPISITLNNQSATTAGTDKIYEWHKHGIYLDNELKKEMTTSANKITNPTRTGYTFNGYYNKTSGGTKLINESSNITSSFTNTYFGKYEKNATIYARWTPNTYTVNLNANGGTVSPTSITVTYDSTYSSLPNATRTGYTFAGWYTEASGGTKITTSTKVAITKNITLYARWTANKYTVSFNANGGSGAPSAITVTYDSTYSTLPSTKPTRTGYTFAGWYTAASGGTKITTSSKVTTASNHTLYAHWTANKYTVSLNANGGSVSPTSITVTYNSTYSSLPTPTRTNYAFLGWYTSTSGGINITNSTKVTITAAQTLYARWAKELQVGDYVSYTPSSASYNWNSNYSGYSGTYSSDGFPSATLSNTNSNYKITSWRVLSINGSTLELVAASPTVGKVPLKGAQGYNNGVKLLNDACSTLYSNSSKGISARSVRLEDITSRLTSSALTEINNYVEKSYKLGTTKKYTSKRYYPVMYASEKGSIINGTKKTTGLGPSEQSSFIEKTASGATNGRLRASSSIKVTETYWYKYITFFKTAFKANGNATSSLYCDLFFPKGATTEYWLSSRFNILGNNLATFQMAYISTDDGRYESYVGGKKLLASNGTFYWDVYELFPLLTLNKSAITYTVSGNTTSYSIK